MKKMKDLQPYLKAMPIFVLSVAGNPIVIDGEKNSTGIDIALLFSNEGKALAYAMQSPSLLKACAEKTTIFDLIDHFQGQVEYFILDRPQ